MSAQPETWRVSTPEGVFETDLATLKQWIAEGCVLPTDKVSKGSFNWIDAGRAPMLRAAFTGEPATAPILEISTPGVEIEPSNALTPTVVPQVDAGKFAVDAKLAATSLKPPFAANVCHNHGERAAEYLCSECAATLCAECPKFVSKVPLCPSCGALCRTYHEERGKAMRQQFQGSGFGWEDFARSVQYPFQHKVALLCGAAVYALLMLAGWRGSLLAYVIMFGCISQVISQVAWGRLNRSFMPDFSAFSMWDDFGVPIGLGIGITIVTWGPTIVLVLMLIFGGLNGSSRASRMVAPGQPAESSQLSSEELSVLTDPEADPKKLEEANKKLQQLRPGYEISRQAERSKNEQSDPTPGLRLLLSYFHAPIASVLLLILSVGWAIVYYPMALAVGGYTQSFGSVINPLVGLDTMRRMGITYVKVFGMVLSLQLVGLIIGIIVAAITAPLALPFFGNLPARFIDGVFAFYFNLVIACILGLGLYKCADRLGITVD